MLVLVVEAGAVLSRVPSNISEDDLIVDQAIGDLDGDRLNHRPIAERVAELVLAAETPSNLALFAPWGAGKTSFGGLLEQAIHSRDEDVAFVPYDAWTYGGESLERNFIGNAARRLGLDPDSKDGRPFFGGLYEKNRSARINLSWQEARSIIQLAGAWLFVILVALAGFSALLALFLKRDPVQAVVDLVPSALPSAGITSLVAAIVTVVVNGARVDLEQGAPTQEQLRARFTQLVDRTTRSLAHPGRPHRIVFFIDELDRCSSEDVVAVLRAIRGFFGERRCVFVVAADRGVLESALAKLPQATPVNVENPYYSSASEFFDKVFQFQVSLPPLRSGRLSGFARSLVHEKSRGLWAELRDEEPGNVDLVVHDLIPSHVRSPRRVKVLLNNFASTVRIAESRGIRTTGRAREIAKLTVLETEFPLFARDLVLAPQLPTLLLDPPVEPSQRLKTLLERHRLPEARGATSEAVLETVTPTDALPDVEEKARPDLEIAQRRLLRTYLARVQDVPNPGWDLLYLAAAGQTVDLADPGLGQALEDRAVDDARAAADLLKGQPEGELRKAIQLLASQGQGEFGLERSRVLTTMLIIAGEVGFELGESRDEALRLISVASREEGLGSENLVPALRIANAAGPRGEAIALAIAGDPRFFTSEEIIEEAAAAADALTEGQRDTIFRALAELAPASPRLFTGPIATLAPTVAVELAETLGPALTDALSELADPPEVEDFVSAFADSALGRGRDAPGVVDSVFLALIAAENGHAYAPLLTRLPSALGVLSPDDADWMIFQILKQAPPEEWATLSERLATEPGDSISTLGEEAANAVAAVFSRPEGADQGAPVATVIERVVPHLRKAKKDIWPLLEASVVSALTRPFTAERKDSQRELDLAALRLAKIGKSLRENIEPLVLADIERPLGARGTFTAGLETVRKINRDLSAPTRTALAESVLANPLAASFPSEVVETRVYMAATARIAKDPNAAQLLPTAEETVQTIAASPKRPHLLTNYLLAIPPATQLARVLSESSFSARNASAFKAWTEAATAHERTQLVLDLVDISPQHAEAWGGRMAGLEGDDRLPQHLLERIRGSTLNEDRRALARVLAAARLKAPNAEKLAAEAVIHLLELRHKTDDTSARLALIGAGRGHQSKGRLEAAIRKAAKRGLRIDAKWVDAIAASDLTVKAR